MENGIVKSNSYGNGLMISAALLLATLTPIAAHAGQEPIKTFQLSFEKGLVADYAAGVSSPVKSRNVSFVDGLTGKGVHIPKDGFILYDLKGNFPAERGSLVIWAKPDWSSSGGIRWAEADWKGIFSTAKAGGVPGVATGRPFGTMLKSMQESMMHYSWYGEDKKGGGDEAAAWCMGQSSFVAGGWKCYVFTWDNKRGVKFFLDGKELSASKPLDRSLGDADGFYLGSALCGNALKGFEGTIDEVAIYDDALSLAQVRALCAGRVPVLSVELMDYAMFSGKENTVRLKYHNKYSSGTASGSFTIVFKDAAGKTLNTLKQAVRLGQGETEVKLGAFNPPVPGAYELVVISDDDNPLCHYQVVAISAEPVVGSAPLTKDGTVKEKLLETIDCAKDYGHGKYRDDGKCRVEKSALGSWRLADGGQKLSGFSYLLNPIPHPGKPHWLEIEYPDNARRSFYVAVFPEEKGQLIDFTLDTIGVLTGGLHPVTNTMQKKRLLFWPNSKNLVVGCYVHSPYLGEAGAALGKISIYEMEGQLPKLDLGAPATSPERLIGVWNEDPTMLMQAWFNHCNFDGGTLPFWETKWNRIAAYLNYTGQNLWHIQSFDYAGDRNTLPETLPQAGNTQRTAGWADLGALTLRREGIDFFLEIHDLTKALNTNVPGGLGKLVGPEHLSGTIEQAMAKGAEAVERFGNDNNYCDAFGKGSGPTLDPLHPKTQAAYLKIVRESAEKFGRYDNFKGIGFLVCDWSSLFYRNLREGYGDYPVNAFMEDTGVDIPVDANDKKRFSKRYVWLMANAKDKWIEWRAKRITAFYRELARALENVAPGRKILLMHRPMEDDRRNFAAWPSPAADLKQYWLEKGVDVKAIGAIDGLMLSPSVDPNWERVGLELESRAKNWNRNGNYFGFSSELSDLHQDAPRHAPLIAHQSNSETYPNFAKEQVASYFFPRRQAAQSPLCHMAFSTPLPDNKYVLEHMARLMADFNPEIIYHGWWGSPDNGAISAFQPFYKAYRLVPLIDFKKVPGAGDPVQIKYGENGDFYYILGVNREYYPVTVALNIETVATEFMDVVDATKVVVSGGKLVLAMKPYQVVCLKSARPVTFKETAMSIPPEIIKGLETKLIALKIAEKTFAAKKLRIAGLVEVIGLVEDALAEKKYSRAHYLMQSGPANEALSHQKEFK